MDSTKAKLQDILLPPERLVLSSYAEAIGHDSGRCMLAVIAHTSHDAAEQACVLILDPASPDVQVEEQIPLEANVDITIVQMSQNSTASTSTPPADPFKQAAANFIVAFGVNDRKLEFIFEELDSIQPFVTTCRKYIGLAEKGDKATPSEAISWSSLYQRPPAELRRIQTLYQATHPLISQLDETQLYSIATVAGDRSREEDTYRALRDRWIRETIQTGSSDFGSSRELRIRIGTFNVNGQVPSGDLKQFVNSPEAEDVDLLVLGFQEVDLSTGALLYSTSTALEEAWTEAVLSCTSGNYEKITSKQLVGILLLVFAPRERTFIASDIRTTYLGSGILGMMGNKGGVAVRLLVDDTVICLVNTHLAALDEMVSRRNADYAYLSNNLYFDLTDETSIYDSHYLFWLVNLNYRIEMPDEEVRELIKDHDWEALRSKDQLLYNKTTGQCFNNFVEAPTNFVPSYQYQVGAQDAALHNLKRRPAWTDRILYRNATRTTLKQLSYISHPEITMSDHKPVSADFAVEIWSTSEQALVTSITNSLEQISLYEKASHDDDAPRRLSVSPNALDFGEFKSNDAPSQTLILRNDTDYPCAFSFVDSESGTALSWLVAEPTSGFLTPGAAIETNIQLALDRRTLERLNMGDTELSDVLIIHVVHGNDVFISAKAQYTRTFLFNSLSCLVRLPGPISAFSGQDIDLLSESQALSAPRELLHMVSWLMNHAEAPEDLFAKRGHPMLVHTVIQLLNDGRTLPQMAPDSLGIAELEKDSLTLAVGTCLLEFLASLPEPVVLPDIHHLCAQVNDRDAAFEVVGSLPMVNTNVWISITSFLHYIAQQSSNPEARVKSLSRVFAPLFFETGLNTVVEITPIKQRAFVALFIAPP